MISERFEPGHYYSVIPHITDSYNVTEAKFSNLDFNDNNHLSIINELENYLTDFDTNFGSSERDIVSMYERKFELKYTLMNGWFEWMDSRLLYYFLQKNRPKKIIEIGSGNSTLLTYNTKKMFNLELDIICIEPYPNESLRMLALQEEITLIENKLEDVEIKMFEELGENDILFIDSTHVAKLNSDVMYYFTQIFPILKSGVMVHIHDIFFPYDYPLDWLKRGMFWNEQYFLYVFLQFNSKFKIQFCCSYAAYKFKDQLENIQKNWYELKNGITESVVGGGSIWLRVT